MKLVCVTGDTHADINRFLKGQAKCLKKGDTIIVAGDFGFLWEGDKQEKKILNQLGKKPYNICFVDGTHENFGLLNSYEVSEWNGGKVHNITGNLYHLMRGQIFEIDGLKIFTMGGGESMDIELRSENGTWFKDEIPTQLELLEGADNMEKAGCRVDVIITHEPPSKVKSFLKLKDSEVTQVSVLNAYFEELGKSCEFGKWYFGSMHVDKYVSNLHVAVFKNILDVKTGKIISK